MKLYFIFTKKGLAVILATVITVLIIIGQISTVNSGYIDGSTNEKRLEYLKSVGISANDTAVSVKQTRIPERFDGIYSEYAGYMSESGFNISDFCGKAVTHYAYGITDSPHKTANLLVFENKIIAGDITDNLSGEITALAKDK